MWNTAQLRPRIQLYHYKMSNPTTDRRQINKNGKSRDAVIAAFWDFSANRVLLNESERLLQIKAGFSAELFHVVRIAFDLQERSLEQLLYSSISTLKRCGCEQKPLNAIASERLDRVAVVCLLAEKVFENRITAASRNPLEKLLQWWISQFNFTQFIPDQD